MADMSDVGYWSVKCGGFGGGIEIEKNNELSMNINDNNLYISAYAKKVGGGTKIFLGDIVESLNDVVNWGNISRNKPIAEVSFQDGKLYLSWKGFFDVKKSRYIWDKEPDFVVASGRKKDIKMEICNFE